MPARSVFPQIFTAADLLAAPTLAQDLRPESLKLFGGTYSPDCSKTSASRVRIAANGLVIAQGKRQVSTPVRMDSYTSFGAAPTSPVPEGYEIEFIGDDFSVYVFQDAKGLHVPLDGYVPKAEAIVGKAAMRARFGRCH